MKNSIPFILLSMLSQTLFSQTLPPIFDSTPKAILKSTILVSFPKNTWVENMIMSNDGMIYATNYPEGKVYKITLSGKEESFAKIDGKIAGIATFNKDKFLVCGWDTSGRPAIFLVNANGTTKKLLNIDGGMFPNGILHFYHDNYLIGDSYAGCIWEYNGTTNEIQTWLKDSLLERSSVNSKSPAANGLKIHNSDLYISNTEKQMLVKVPLKNHQPGIPEIFINRVNIDDFAFDAFGNIYAATNVYNSVIKITLKKQVSIVADLSSGAAGSTAVLFAKDLSGKKVLYVSTSGGMGLPPPSGVEEGKVITLFLQ